VDSGRATSSPILLLYWARDKYVPGAHPLFRTGRALAPGRVTTFDYHAGRGGTPGTRHAWYEARPVRKHLLLPCRAWGHARYEARPVRSTPGTKHAWYGKEAGSEADTSFVHTPLAPASQLGFASGDIPPHFSSLSHSNIRTFLSLPLYIHVHLSHFFL